MTSTVVGTSVFAFVELLLLAFGNAVIISFLGKGYTSYYKLYETLPLVLAYGFPKRLVT